MKLNRGWWLAFVLAPGAVALGSSTAKADTEVGVEGLGELPHGVRLVGGQYSIDVCDHDEAGYCLSHRLLPDDYSPERNGPLFGPGKSAPASTWMAPTDVLKAYSIPSSSSGAGRIVALVDEPDANAYSDITTYRAGFKLPALPKCAGGLPDGKTACFAQVDESGAPNSDSEDCTGGDGETGLDMAMVSAACPDCAILVVQMTSLYSDGECRITSSNFSPALLHATQTAATLGASATSISFGGPEGGKDPTGYTTKGHLVLVASGDDGYDFGKKGGTPSYPASSPDVLGIGGTNLAASGGTYTETVWNNDVGVTTSGCSTEFAMPAFQKTYLASHSTAFGGCTMRASADLSAAASFGPGKGGSRNDGIALVDGGEWVAYWGTSAASPMVAAILTRLNLTDAISANLGFVYTNESAWNDVTSGDDDAKEASCTTDMCVAGKGWDGPTGLGTPNGEDLQKLGSGGSDGGVEDGGGKHGGGKADAGGHGVVDSGAGGTLDATVGTVPDDAGTRGDPMGVADDAGAYGSSASSGGCSIVSAGRSSAPDAAAFPLAGLALGLLVRRRRR